MLRDFVASSPEELIRDDEYAPPSRRRPVGRGQVADHWSLPMGTPMHVSVSHDQQRRQRVAPRSAGASRQRKSRPKMPTPVSVEQQQELHFATQAKRPGSADCRLAYDRVVLRPSTPLATRTADRGAGSSRPGTAGSRRSSPAAVGTPVPSRAALILSGDPAMLRRRIGHEHQLAPAAEYDVPTLERYIPDEEHDNDDHGGGGEPTTPRRRAPLREQSRILMSSSHRRSGKSSAHASLAPSDDDEDEDASHYMDDVLRAIVPTNPQPAASSPASRTLARDPAVSSPSAATLDNGDVLESHGNLTPKRGAASPRDGVSPQRSPWVRQATEVELVTLDTVGSYTVAATAAGSSDSAGLLRPSDRPRDLSPEQRVLRDRAARAATEKIAMQQLEHDSTVDRGSRVRAVVGPVTTGYTDLVPTAAGAGVDAARAEDIDDAFHASLAMRGNTMALRAYKRRAAQEWDSGWKRAATGALEKHLKFNQRGIARTTTGIPLGVRGAIASACPKPLAYVELETRTDAFGNHLEGLVSCAGDEDRVRRAVAAAIAAAQLDGELVDWEAVVVFPRERVFVQFHAVDELRGVRAVGRLIDFLRRSPPRRDVPDVDDVLVPKARAVTDIDRTTLLHEAPRLLTEHMQRTEEAFMEATAKPRSKPQRIARPRLLSFADSEDPAAGDESLDHSDAFGGAGSRRRSSSAAPGGSTAGAEALLQDLMATEADTVPEQEPIARAGVEDIPDDAAPLPTTLPAHTFASPEAAAAFDAWKQQRRFLDKHAVVVSVSEFDEGRCEALPAADDAAQLLLRQLTALGYSTDWLRTDADTAAATPTTTFLRPTLANTIAVLQHVLDHTIAESSSVVLCFLSRGFVTTQRKKRAVWGSSINNLAPGARVVLLADTVPNRLGPTTCLTTDSLVQLTDRFGVSPLLFVDTWPIAGSPFAAPQRVNPYVPGAPRAFCFVHGRPGLGSTLLAVYPGDAPSNSRKNGPGAATPSKASPMKTRQSPQASSVALGVYSGGLGAYYLSKLLDGGSIEGAVVRLSSGGGDLRFDGTELTCHVVVEMLHRKLSRTRADVAADLQGSGAVNFHSYACLGDALATSGAPSGRFTVALLTRAVQELQALAADGGMSSSSLGSSGRRPRRDSLASSFATARRSSMAATAAPRPHSSHAHHQHDTRAPGSPTTASRMLLRDATKQVLGGAGATAMLSLLRPLSHGDHPQPVVVNVNLWARVDSKAQRALPLPTGAEAKAVNSNGWRQRRRNLWMWGEEAMRVILMAAGAVPRAASQRGRFRRVISSSPAADAPRLVAVAVSTRELILEYPTSTAHHCMVERVAAKRFTSDAEAAAVAAREARGKVPHPLADTTAATGSAVPCAATIHVACDGWPAQSVAAEGLQRHPAVQPPTRVYVPLQLTVALCTTRQLRKLERAVATDALAPAFVNCRRVKVHECQKDTRHDAAARIQALFHGSVVRRAIRGEQLVAVAEAESRADVEARRLKFAMKAHGEFRLELRLSLTAEEERCRREMRYEEGSQRVHLIRIRMQVVQRAEQRQRELVEWRWRLSMPAIEALHERVVLVRDWHARLHAMHAVHRCVATEAWQRYYAELEWYRELLAITNDLTLDMRALLRDVPVDRPDPPSTAFEAETNANGASDNDAKPHHDDARMASRIPGDGVFAGREAPAVLDRLSLLLAPLRNVLLPRPNEHANVVGSGPHQ